MQLCNAMVLVFAAFLSASVQIALAAPGVESEGTAAGALSLWFRDATPTGHSLFLAEAQLACAGEFEPEREEVGDKSATEGSDAWTFELTLYPYLIPARVDGSSTVAGLGVPLSFHLKEVVNDLTFSSAVRLEAWKGKLGLTLDGVYTHIEGDPLSLGPFSPDVEIVQAALEFGFSYRFLELDPREDTETEADFGLRLTAEFMGGGRYAYLKQRVNPGPLPTLGRSEDWVEPWVGMRFRVPVSERVRFATRFDFGGFGVGSASKLTWNIIAGMDYRLKENMDLKLGYRIYDTEYSNGSGLEKFGFDGKIHGPTFGLSIRF